VATLWVTSAMTASPLGSRPDSALAHFELFQRDPLAGMLTLDLLGMVSHLLFVPVILAVYVSVRRSSEALAATAVALFVLGVADFLATNTAFPVLSLSARYAAAVTDADRAAILAAGEAMFTLFNENAFLVSYVIVSASWALLGVAMLRSDAFSTRAAWCGILAGASGIVAVALEHGSPSLVAIAIPVYFGAILFLFAWVLLIAYPHPSPSEVRGRSRVTLCRGRSAQPHRSAG
jgi:uncharacterized protein DUF4386